MRLNIATAICLLQRPGVFPTSSGCFRAPGSTLEAAPWRQHQARNNSTIQCLAHAAPCSCPLPMHWQHLHQLLFQRCFCQTERLNTLCAQAGSSYRWLLPLVSESAALRPNGNSHKYCEKQAGFILIGINTAPNIPVGQKRGRGLAVWLDLHTMQLEAVDSPCSRQPTAG